MKPRTVAIFGASGAIGQALCAMYAERQHTVVGIGRHAADASMQADHWITWQGGADTGALSALAANKPDAIVWAQGSNASDSIFDFDLARHEAMYAANVSYILISLHALLHQQALAAGARLCIISSIWQNIARQNKLSYTVSKSALQGLVQSLAVDLGPSGHLVNAVLPGPLNTPMTRANLTPAQLQHFEQSAPLHALPALTDVCHLVGFLCSAENTGITGQFIAADSGYSHARHL
jgi:NAD(P)-dependent dehydrogenase (short-subunit alcohol dehydrogenase family)